MTCLIIRKKNESFEVYRKKLFGKVFIDRKPSFALAKKLVVSIGATRFDYEDQREGKRE